MVILKILLRDYLVASCPAISQNIYMYPRAGEVIEIAGQLGSCPQKVLANDAGFVCRMDTEPLQKERLKPSIDTSKKNIKTHPANPMTRRVKIFRFYTNSSDMPWITIRIVSASMNRSYSRLLIENLMFLEIHPSSLGVLTKHVPCP